LCEKNRALIGKKKGRHWSNRKVVLFGGKRLHVIRMKNEPGTKERRGRYAKKKRNRLCGEGRVRKREGGGIREKKRFRNPSPKNRGGREKRQFRLDVPLTEAAYNKGERKGGGRKKNLPELQKKRRKAKAYSKKGANQHQSEEEVS